MAIQKEFWVNYILKRFWKDNAFLKNAYSDDQYVIGGKIVHIPQPGSKPTVIKNRTNFPGTAVKRTDTDITYSLDEYTSDPTHITDAEKVELSYSKIDSILTDHAGVLNQTVANDILIKFLDALPQANLIKTTGAGVLSKIPGQTGNRKATTFKELKAARLAMNLADVSGADRYALFEENMLDELIDGLSLTAQRDFSKYYDAQTGVIGMLYGFKVMSRSSVVMALDALDGSNNLQVLPLGTAVNATDQAISFCWQKDAIARALGEVKFFENQNDPQYYGDVYSALLRMGGRRRRSDSGGVIAIKQDASP